VERSRREVFTTHAGDRDRLARCPICRMAIEKDHEEALEMTIPAQRAPAPQPASFAFELV
jgi:hypothetical protein